MDTRTFYDRISGVYDRLADSSEGACRERGLRMLAVTSGERVLEVGCGTGHALAALASVAGPTGHAVGIDVSSGMLAMAQETVRAAAVAKVRFALCDARALCFADETFDAAFMSFTLESFAFADIPVVLGEVGRVLRSNGRLGVVAMAETEHSNAMIDLYKWLHRHFPHFIDCQPIKVNQWLDRAGFTITGAQPMVIWGLSVVCVVGSKRGTRPR
jgi:ubiquinone/menaquinone biosynthesis C-methylase UbiE